MANQPTNKVLQELHLKMVRIRRFEEEAGRMMENAKIPGALHLYVGQEAVAAGVMQHLSNDDQITSTHRGHGHLVAKGGEFSKMFAELFGRSTGYCRGKGGSMHVSNMELGMLGANGIVGGGPPIAMGAAFANRFLKSKKVAVAFFGDGASNEGSFHEAINMAALYKLPCIFVCENNGYGEYTPQANHQTIVDVADRAAGYGIPGVVVDGMDVLAVYEAAAEAIDRARKGEGPTLLEAKTYRYYDHVGVRGMGLSYRTDEELEAWKKRDPIHSFEAQLIDLGVMTRKKIESVYSRVSNLVEEGIAFAESSPFPEPSELLDNVYCETRSLAAPRAPTEPDAATSRKLTYVDAIHEGVRETILEQNNAFVAGEDVGQAGGPFGQYSGLYPEFGKDRIIDTPISEKGIIGLGVGASASGCRPIIDLMFIDFIGECMDEVSNQMAKMRFMFGGGVTLPVTVLTMAGAGMSMAAQHSQSLEAWLAHLPGVKVVMPSNPYDAKGLIIAANRDDNPVFVILNKVSLALQGEVPEGAYEIEIGKANIVRPGTDFTIVAISRMVHEAIKAADSLSELGIDVEIIDPRSIQPFDIDTVVNSIKKTHRGLVVHEAVEFGGIGGEIVAQISNLAFDYLDAPIGRVGAPFAPVPFSPALEEIYVPDSDNIIAKVKETLGLD